MKQHHNSKRVYDLVIPISPTCVIVSGSEMIQACSTSYLALNWDANVRERIANALNVGGQDLFASLGSNYLGGLHPSKEKLEQVMAELTLYERCLALSSGWTANYAIAEYVGNNFEHIISHPNNHNSIIEGLRKFKDKVSILKIDEDILESLFHRPGRTAIIYPSIEGITGEQSIIPPKNQHSDKVILISDESHSFGMFGNRGLDTPNGQRPDIRILGFSKALGSVGAIITGQTETIEWLEQASSPWIFSTPLPPYIWDINTLLLSASLDFKAERDAIFDSASYFRERLRIAKIPFTGDHHITGLNLQIRCSAREAETFLFSRQVFLKISGYPSVKYGTSRARVVFNQYHSRKEIDCVFDSVFALYQKYN
ncbi:7-keto-8-aminopelargonate synthetase [Dyadobacter soli]|uniref:7-keto-8-aminopelargonate synthetase n=1 Tax=Dyadobacter soli TaxID=659014 RepID=A0A1G7MSF1_9BACT|nr:aminotransferase class I/II-fold pyridoxal phosphate-dependent enzyme [Dyadobacter soli]SDF63990.1 7-keto-8-aminopelargonate synthetase [Dyadobacter soli]